MSEPSSTRLAADALAAQRWQTLLAAHTHDGAAPWLHEEVGLRMAQRLQWIKRSPVQWVNWRARTSGAAVHQAVQKHYPDAALRFAPQGYESARSASLLIGKKSGLSTLMQRWRGAGAALVPAEEGAAQLLWANMSLHNEVDPLACIQAWHRLLEVDGMLMFSCLGPDSALQLQQIYAKRSWGPAAYPLTDMHDWGDALVRSGFADPVMDMERLELGFSSAQLALAELRGLGRNLHPQRFGGLRGKAWRAQLLSALAQSGGGDGQVVLSFEVIYGHAIKAKPSVAVSKQTSIDLAQMRAMLRSAKPRE